MTFQTFLLLPFLGATLSSALSIRSTSPSVLTELATVQFGETADWFPVDNATFWINPNGTLAEDASAKTTTASSWANPFPM